MVCWQTVRYFHCSDALTDGISVPLLLESLGSLGVRSVMVEGGASVIKSFLTSAQSRGSGSVDAIVVTVAPIFVGKEGVGYGDKLFGDQVSTFKLLPSCVGQFPDSSRLDSCNYPRQDGALWS